VFSLKEVLNSIPIGYLVRILRALYEAESQGIYMMVRSMVAEKAGIPPSTYFGGLKHRLLAGGLFEEVDVTRRVKALKLTDKGRRMAECILKCTST